MKLRPLPSGGDGVAECLKMRRVKSYRLSLANYTTKLLPFEVFISSELENPEKTFLLLFQRPASGLARKRRDNIVGLSLNYLSQALCTFCIAGFLKKQAADVKVILGALVTS